MSKKIVLTTDQDKAIKELKRIQSNMQENERNGHLIKEKSRGGWRSTNFKAANDIPFEDFVDALIKGYEIEQPKVKVGEWATNTECNHTFKVYAVTDDRIVREEDARFWDRGHTNVIRLYTHKKTRPSTKEEIIFAELGREIGEFREGDLGVGTPNNRYERVENLVTHYQHKTLTGFYPAESFVEFPK